MAEYLSSPPTIELDEANERFIVKLPGDKALGHGISFRVDVEGLRLLYDVLRRRNAMMAQGEAPTIGTKGSPTQQMVDAFIKAHGVARPKTKRELEDEALVEQAKSAGIKLKIDLRGL
jgi:hypothetical protein